MDLLLTASCLCPSRIVSVIPLLFGENIEDLQLYIDPEECIDCGACEPECPVEAIFEESEVPEEWNKFIAKNYEFFDQEAP